MNRSPVILSCSDAAGSGIQAHAQMLVPIIKEAFQEMTMKIQPYLFFDGQCESAMTFYARAVGGVVEFSMRYGDSPDPVPPEHLPPGGAQSILHGRVRIGDSVLMMSDGVAPEGGGFRGFSLSLQYQEEGTARRVFDALAEDGRVLMPLTPTFFSPCYGMLQDRFGVQWMVMVVDPQAG